MSTALNIATLKTWAVVGASSNPSKFGNIVFKRLLGAGRKVIPINPRLDALDGHVCIASLSELNTIPDVVSVIVPHALGMQVVQDAADLGVKHIWFQPGAESDEAISLAQTLGLTVIHHDCILLHL